MSKICLPMFEVKRQGARKRVHAAFSKVQSVLTSIGGERMERIDRVLTGGLRKKSMARVGLGETLPKSR